MNNIAKTALLWTGIFISVFWIIVQESSRIDLQDRIEQLEQENKGKGYSEHTLALQNSVKQIEQETKGYSEQISTLQYSVKQIEQGVKRINYFEQISTLQERVKKLEQELEQRRVKQPEYKKNKSFWPNTNITRSNR